MGPEHPERRQNDIKVALLVQGLSDLKESVDALHAKFDAKILECAEHKERTAKSESAITYHLLNAGATWGAVLGLGSWVILNMMDMKEMLATMMHIKGVR